MPERFRRPAEHLRLLAQSVDAKADYFPGHSDSVAYLVRLMANSDLEADFSGEDLADLQDAAILHDVGKLLIPMSILTAPRQLTSVEYEVIKQHSRWGERIASQSGVSNRVPDWILHHHERWDGHGYPDGLAGEDIPLASRMLLVADAFAVMTTDRNYRYAMTRQQAIDELERETGKQFCVRAVELLVSRSDDIGMLPDQRAAGS